jgi:hypothetical protein
MEMSGQVHAQAALHPRKEPPVPRVRLDAEKIIDLMGLEHRPSAVQPVASRYTD